MRKVSSNACTQLVRAIDMRRGRPSCPKAFDEATAILRRLYPADTSVLGVVEDIRAAVAHDAEVAKLAALHGIQVRPGCFCTPGACPAFLRRGARAVGRARRRARTP